MYGAKLGVAAVAEIIFLGGICATGTVKKGGERNGVADQMEYAERSLNQKVPRDIWQMQKREDRRMDARFHYHWKCAMEQLLLVAPQMGTNP